jgi:hypothetical protein
VIRFYVCLVAFALRQLPRASKIADSGMVFQPDHRIKQANSLN